MIHKQKTDWGVRLTDHPLPAPNEDAYIQADIKGRDIRFSFSGTLPGRPLKVADLLVWSNAIKALADASTSFRK